MSIRFANLDDIPALVEVGRRMHQLTRFRNLAYDEDKVHQSLTDVLRRGQHKYVCFVAEDGNKEVIGGLLGVLEQPLFSDQLVATVMYFIVLPERRLGGYGVRLLRAFEQWARNRSVVEIGFGVNSGEAFERIERYVQRMGYRKVGGNYARSLK